MAALLLCIALFGYWAAIGYALFAVAPARILQRERILLSPAIGAAVVVVPIFGLNHLGLAVESFATPLLASIAIAAAGVLAWKRPAFPWRRTLPLFAIVGAALLLAGWPMLIYGFDWASYNNSDMTHYSLGASRVLHGGFFKLPDQQAVLHGTDFPVYDAYNYLLYNARAGSELMLAALWQLTGLDAHRLFMPVTIAMHLALIAATGAMVAGPGRPRKAAAIVMVLMAISPLTTMGALYQLIAQVGGLTFLCASVALLFRSPPTRLRAADLVARIPVVLAMAGLFIWYPENLPFLGAGWFVFIAALAARRRDRARAALAHAAMSGVLLLFVLNVYLLGAVQFMLSQAQSGAGVSGNVLQPADLAVSAFPYFLVPAGIPLFWGILPIAGYGSTQYLTHAIAFGALLSLWFIAGLWQASRRARPAAAVFAVMSLLAVVLFQGKKDFGLFKLAMYAQPFALALIGEQLAARRGLVLRGTGWVLVGAASIAALVSQYAYALISTGEYLTGLAEIWHASAMRINSQFPEVVAALRQKSPAGYTSDTANVVQLQHQTLYSRGYSALYPAFSGYSMHEKWRYADVVRDMPEERSIALAGKETHLVLAPHLKEELARRWLVTIPRYDSIVNLAHAGPESPQYYRIAAPEKVANHLIFMPSDMGAHYYGLAFGGPIAINHIEHDPMFPGRQFSGLGRDLLFLLFNPSPRPRVVMEVTATTMRQFDAQLPKATIRGAARTAFGFVGHGSARLVSPPVEPVYLDGVPFLAIDMERDARLTPYEARGLMRLFGAGINPDLRYMTANCRDVSLLSEADYAALQPPSQLRHFPADLANPGLQYSGLYEDGLISEEALVVLGGNPTAKAFRFRGFVPEVDDLGFRTTMSIRVDQGPVVKTDLPLGDFSVDVPIPKPSGGAHRVEIGFSKWQRLPYGDQRIIGARMRYLGLVAGP